MPALGVPADSLQLEHYQYYIPSKPPMKASFLNGAASQQEHAFILAIGPLSPAAKYLVVSMMERIALSLHASFSFPVVFPNELPNSHYFMNAILDGIINVTQAIKILSLSLSFWSGVQKEGKIILLTLQNGSNSRRDLHLMQKEEHLLSLLYLLSLKFTLNIRQCICLLSLLY